MYQLTPATTSLFDGKTFRFATCWKIVRKDGQTFRVTTHNASIDLAPLGSTTPEIYTPAGSFDPTARQKLSDMRERNLDVKGMFDAAAITFDDLAAGKYRGATVTEIIVDWRYPWAGYFNHTVYYVGQTRFNGEYWEAQLDGVTTFLKKEVGRVYGRQCQWNLGDSNCTVNLAPLTHNGTVTSVNPGSRIGFQSSLTQADNYYNFGTLTWTSGANNGTVCDIEYYVNSGGGIQLFIPVYNAIQVGDTFTAVAGCDRSVPTCRNRFNNLVNYGGFPTVPGTDTLLATPKF